MIRVRWERRLRWCTVALYRLGRPHLRHWLIGPKTACGRAPRERVASPVNSTNICWNCWAALTTTSSQPAYVAYLRTGVNCSRRDYL